MNAHGLACTETSLRSHLILIIPMYGVLRVDGFVTYQGQATRRVLANRPEEFHPRALLAAIIHQPGALPGRGRRFSRDGCAGVRVRCHVESGLLSV